MSDETPATPVLDAPSVIVERPPEPDTLSPREAAQRLYESGLSPAHVAMHIGSTAGSIRAWASRYGWSRPSIRVASVAPPPVAPVAPATVGNFPQPVSESGKNFPIKTEIGRNAVMQSNPETLVARVEGICERWVDTLERTPPEEWGELERGSRVVKALQSSFPSPEVVQERVIVVLGQVESLIDRDQAPAIDVQSSQVIDPE